MLTLAPAQGEGGLVGYGLGIDQRALPGGAELIGHLGGPAYRSYVGRLHPRTRRSRSRSTSTTIRRRCSTQRARP